MTFAEIVTVPVLDETVRPLLPKVRLNPPAPSRTALVLLPWPDRKFKPLIEKFCPNSMLKSGAEKAKTLTTSDEPGRVPGSFVAPVVVDQFVEPRPVIRFQLSLVAPVQ